MKIGVKIFPQDLDYIPDIAKHCDFLEVMAIPGSDFKILKKFHENFSIHVAHERWGSNLANPVKKKTNDICSKAASDAADILDADNIVIHPGFIESKSCTADEVIESLAKLDSRFIVENMPPFSMHDCQHIGSTVEELSRIMSASNKGLCLDVVHAACFAYKEKMDYLDFLKQLLKLKPKYFHIYNTKEGIKDQHSHLKDGYLDIEKIVGILPDDAMLLLETPHGIKEQIEDVSRLRKLI